MSKELHSPYQGGYSDYKPKPPLPEENWPYHRRPRSGNDRQFADHKPKFEKIVYVRRDQIFYDIDTQISIVSKARRKQDGSEEDTLSSGTSPYQSQFERWVTRYLGLAKGVMAAYTLEKFRTSKLNTIDESEEDTITLFMPEYWDDTVFEQLVQSIHDYIVNSCLHEFFSLTLTSKDPLTQDKRDMAQQAMYDIKRFANATKPGRIDKTLQPF